MNNTNQAREAVKTAETQLKQLRDAATLAEREAGTAQTDFEDDPSDSAFTTASVAKQRAKNARSAAERYERTELAQAREALKTAERDAVKASLNAAEEAMKGKLDGAVATLLEAIRQFGAASNEMVAFETARQQAAESGVRSSFSLSQAMHNHTRALNNTIGLVRTSPAVGVFSSGPEEPVFAGVDGMSIRFKLLCGFPVAVRDQGVEA